MQLCLAITNTKLDFLDQDTETLLSTLNSELLKILIRLKANKLSHNLSKINYTLFHLPKNNHLMKRTLVEIKICYICHKKPYSIGTWNIPLTTWS